MISIPRRRAGHGCSPYPTIGVDHWWVHSTGVSSVERSSTGAPYQTLTCQDDVLAGQLLQPGKFDTEAVAQRASTALNGIKVQVKGGVEDDNFIFVEGERFLVTESPARSAWWRVTEGRPRSLSEAARRGRVHKDDRRPQCTPP
jgi:hypothetical protein